MRFDASELFNSSFWSFSQSLFRVWLLNSPENYSSNMQLSNWTLFRWCAHSVELFAFSPKLPVKLCQFDALIFFFNSQIWLNNVQEIDQFFLRYLNKMQRNGSSQSVLQIVSLLTPYIFFLSRKSTKIEPTCWSVITRYWTEISQNESPFQDLSTHQSNFAEISLFGK